MRVFISWSGHVSEWVATALFNWIPQVLPGVEPFMSSESIRSGQRWLSEINSELDEAEVGLICVTRTNQTSAWLQFEAGAIAKLVNKNQVIPIAIDMSTEEIEPPLSQFQGQTLTKKGANDLILDLNACLPKPRPDGHLTKAFELYWPLLEEQIKKMPPHTNPAPRTSQDKIDEILQLLRSGNRDEPDSDNAYQSTGTVSLQKWENDVSRFRLGTKLRHKDFGLGQITEIKGVGKRTVAQVSFADGPKRLLLAIAPVEIVQ